MPALDTALVISEVSKRPILWDPISENFKNTAYKRKIWQEVASVVVPDYKTMNLEDKCEACKYSYDLY